ncbi:MAG: hypothetical protein AAGC67_09105 [Myxococcota bacterium]
MSIQPNRVIAKIIHQVDQADWPPLRSEVYAHDADDGWLRVYRAPADPRYATAIHFWVHALRDELAAVGRRVDLVGAAGHALCRARPVGVWLESLEANADFRARGQGAVLREALDAATGAELHWMLLSECRRSSVLDLRDGFVADFWGHGAGPSWRRRAGWPI